MFRWAGARLAPWEARGVARPRGWLVGSPGAFCLGAADVALHNPPPAPTTQGDEPDSLGLQGCPECLPGDPAGSTAQTKKGASNTRLFNSARAGWAQPRRPRSAVPASGPRRRTPRATLAHLVQRLVAAALLELAGLLGALLVGLLGAHGKASVGPGAGSGQSRGVPGGGGARGGAGGSDLHRRGKSTRLRSGLNIRRMKKLASPGRPSGQEPQGGS